MAPAERETVFGASRPRALALIFAGTGFSALTLQVVWQRVISIHGGVDLFSATTVVSAFMAGLGLGNLLGGTLADRLGSRGSLLAYAAANAGIGLFGWGSIRLFYDGYQAIAPRHEGLLSAFAFHFALLAVPTTLMGLSLPLLARSLVRSIPEAAPLVGRLYAVNTLGAALGAAVSGWWLLGTFGFEGTAQVAATLNLLAAAAIFTLWRKLPDGPQPSFGVTGAPPSAPSAPSWPWFVIYGLTGAVALGLEIVHFRLVDAIMRSNSYTFAHVLTLYLLLFAAGAAVGARKAGGATSPERAFLWLQYAVGLSSLAGVVLLVHTPAVFGMRKMLEGYFATDGYLAGPQMPSSARSAIKMLFAHFTGPLLVMGVPVFLMGASYPFVMALVARRLETLGRRTGLLMAANICGNVLGSLAVGFFLIEHLGTSGTLRLLSAVLLVAGWAAALLRPGRGRAILAAGATAAMAALLVVFPSNFRLWGFLHSAGPERFVLREERTCVNSLVRHGEEEVLYLNATSQNGYPYDDFHILIGWMPALMHEGPERALPWDWESAPPPMACCKTSASRSWTAPNFAEASGI